MKIKQVLAISYISLGFVYSLCLLLGMFVPNFLLELGISYLPQLVYLSSIILAVNSVITFALLVFRHYKPGRKAAGQGRGETRKLWWLWYSTNGALFLITIIGALMIYNFAYKPVEHEQSRGEGEEITKEVKFASYNKLYTNKDYKAVEASIKAENPDVLAIIELNEKDLSAMKILEQYPYQLTSRAKVYRGERVMVGIFSKFPLNNGRINPIPQLANVQAEFDPDPDVSGDEFTVIALHTTAPVTPNYFSDRSQQLDLIAAHINDFPSNHQVVLAGDFNLSPWSPEYRSFAANVNLVNTAQGQGLNYTWDFSKYSKLPITNAVITSHIDHIFTSKNIELAEPLEVHEKSGSDHSLVTVTIKP